MGSVEHQKKLGWIISGIAAFGFCVFLSQTRACWHHWQFPDLFSPLSHKQKGGGAPSIPIFCPAQVSPLSRRAKEVKIREKFFILVLKINSSTFKIDFLSLAVKQMLNSSLKNTGSSWNYKHTRPGAKLSLARQWQKLPVDLSFMWCFFSTVLRSSKLIAARLQYWILIVPGVKMGILTSDRSWSRSSANFQLGFIPVYW